MPPRQQPWASGKHKPGQRGKPKTAYGRIWDNTKRSYAKATRKHPWINLVLQVVFGLVAVVALVLGSVLQSVLWWLVLALSGLGTLAIRRAQQMERDRQASRPRPRPTSAGPKTPPPDPEAKPTQGGSLKCSATGRPLDGDNPCDCHSRHVRQQKNADRLGLRIGDPYGKRK